MSFSCLGFSQLFESVVVSFTKFGRFSVITSLNMLSGPNYLFCSWNYDDLTIRYFAVVSLVSLSIVLSSRSLIFFLCLIHSATEYFQRVFNFSYCILSSIISIRFFYIFFFCMRFSIFYLFQRHL